MIGGSCVGNIRKETQYFCLTLGCGCFQKKFKSRWSRPFLVKKVYPFGAVDIWSEKSREFKMNDQRLKHYMAEHHLGESWVHKLSEPIPS
jgi:hypothetical protein